MTPQDPARHLPPNLGDPALSLDRRGFLRGLLTLGGAGLLSACAGAPATPAAPAATSASAAGTPRKGGVYRTVTNEPFGTLDSALAFNYMDWWLSYNLLYNTLYRFDAKGQLYAELADGMPQVSADGLTYTVKLRPDIRFHNGRTVTAADVKFTFDRCVWPETASPGASYLTNIVGYDDVANNKTKDLAGVKVLDPATVAFTIGQPQSVFPAILSITTFGLVPQAEVTAAGKDWGSKVLIGTGPFKLKEWKNGERLTLERNLGYHKPNLPYLDAIDVQLGIKPENAVLQWESGSLEFVNVEAVPAADLGRIRGDAKLKGLIREGPGMIWYRLALANIAPFTDLKVRQAFAYAIDKVSLAKRSQRGVPLDGLFPGTLQGRPDFKSPYQYDPEKAKALLKEAGIAPGTRFSFVSSALNQELSEMVQADMQAIGLQIELLGYNGSGVSYGEVFAPKVRSGEIPLSARGFGPDYPDAGSFADLYLVCGKDPPKASFCDAKLGDLAKQTGTLKIDDPQRTALFHQMEQIAIEQVYYVPLYASTALVLSQAYVRDDLPDPLLTLPDSERVWYEQ